MNKATPGFSNLYRTQTIDQLCREEWDLIVIGGGVTGCGIAFDAAHRGLKTVLLEKGDFASGTSSKSTKLIHGGLRYLKQLDFGLVRETGTERAIVHKLAPHLVVPEKMLIPLSKGGTYGWLGTALGLWVYDVLAQVDPQDRRQMLSKKETLEREPLLNPKILQGGGYYAEYRTDDARLTLELAKGAAARGAIMLNYMEAGEFLIDDSGQVSGVRMTDHLTGRQLSISALKVVSAGGPWVDTIRQKVGPLGRKHLRLTKGVHLVFPREKLPVQQALYFDTPDGRMVFAIPRDGSTYVGTTDTFYQGNPDRVVVTQQDAIYLVEAVNAVFPSVNLRVADAQSSWAGLRPLIHQDGKSPSELSRKDEIFVSPNGLLSIAGGKLTGYRKMAQRILDRIFQDLEAGCTHQFQDCRTDRIPLTPDPFTNYAEVASYTEKVKEQLSKYRIDPERASYLVGNYGRQTSHILSDLSVYPDDLPEVALARAELKMTIEHEAVARAEDFFVRRTGRLFFDITGIPMVRKAVLDDLETAFCWTSERREQEERLLDQALADASTFYQQEEVAS